MRRRFLFGSLIAITTVASAFSQVTIFTTASAGNWSSIVAPDSIAAGFGNILATSTTVGTLPLPTNLGGATLTITDSAGMKLPVPMFFVSPGQINYLVPAGTALGKGTIAVSANNTTFVGTVQIANVSPGIFTANNDGAGVAAAQTVTVGTDGKATLAPAFRVGVLLYLTNPIDLSSGNVFLILYGTGFRKHSAPVTANIGGTDVPVAFAGAQGTLPGLDQINLGPLPQSLANTGRGDVNLVITVDGILANITHIAFR